MPWPAVASSRALHLLLVRRHRLGVEELPVPPRLIPLPQRHWLLAAVHRGPFPRLGTSGRTWSLQPRVVVAGLASGQLASTLIGTRLDDGGVMMVTSPMARVSTAALYLRVGAEDMPGRVMVFSATVSMDHRGTTVRLLRKALTDLRVGLLKGHRALTIETAGRTMVGGECVGDLLLRVASAADWGEPRGTAQGDDGGDF